MASGSAAAHFGFLDAVRLDEPGKRSGQHHEKSKRSRVGVSVGRSAWRVWKDEMPRLKRKATPEDDQRSPKSQHQDRTHARTDTQRQTHQAQDTADTQTADTHQRSPLRMSPPHHHPPPVSSRRLSRRNHLPKTLGGVLWTGMSATAHGFLCMRRVAQLADVHSARGARPLLKFCLSKPALPRARASQSTRVARACRSMSPRAWAPAGRYRSCQGKQVRMMSRHVSVVPAWLLNACLFTRRALRLRRRR